MTQPATPFTTRPTAGQHRLAPRRSRAALLGIQRQHCRRHHLGGLRAAPRRESQLSPKLALSSSPGDAGIFKGSVGRAPRLPTVAELYQGSINAGIDNLGKRASWAFHPDTQRTYSAELRYDH